MGETVSEGPDDRGSLQLPAIRSHVLGVEVIRGYAPLADLAAISRADVYDAKNNPTGTQRDLSPKHAREAYEYVQREEIGFWPEVFLALRNKNVFKFKLIDPKSGFGIATIDAKAVDNSDDIAISRVDGNHRLHFADGKSDGYPRIEKLVSYCLAININLDTEIKLFRDINNNQKRMNTSHLDNIKLRLTPSYDIRTRDKPLFLANALAKDTDSPLFGIVYDGGISDVRKFIPLRTLKTGLEYMLSRPTRLTALEDPQLQVIVIKNYFSALKKWQPDAWKAPGDYLLLRGAGLWGSCFLGAEVIDRALAQGKYKPDDMLKVLRSGRVWDWSKDGPFRGFSGRSGAVRIRDLIVAEMVDEAGISLKAVMKQIADEN